MATIARWDPFRDLMEIQGELNRLFGRTYGSAEDNGGASALATGAWAPAVDVYEDKDKVLLHVELPGVEPDDVEVSVEDSTLSIRGQREIRSDLDQENYRRVERRYGQFVRAFQLPAIADAERVDASFDKGVLTIDVPKKEEARPRRIEIKANA
jgi:HSP20 family protein